MDWNRLIAGSLYEAPLTLQTVSAVCNQFSPNLSVTIAKGFDPKLNGEAGLNQFGQPKVFIYSPTVGTFLHEVAHVMKGGMNHSRKWRDNFRALVAWYKNNL